MPKQPVMKYMPMNMAKLDQLRPGRGRGGDTAGSAALLNVPIRSSDPQPQLFATASQPTLASAAAPSRAFGNPPFQPLQPGVRRT